MTLELTSQAVGVWTPMNKEEAKKEIENEFRDQTDMGARSGETAPEQDFTDDLVAVLEGLESGRGSKVVTANAPRLWALLEALDENDERRAEFYENIDSDFDNSDGEINRSALLKHLVRLALEDHDPELIASLKRAKNEAEESDDLL